MATFQYPRMFNRDKKQCQLNTKATDMIKQSLHLLILSCYGELLGDPNFGASITNFLFDKITGATMDILKMKILAAIEKTLSALEVSEDDIEISQAEDPNTVTIKITYQIRNTQFRNMYQEDITNVNE